VTKKTGIVLALALMRWKVGIRRVAALVGVFATTASAQSPSSVASGDLSSAPSWVGGAHAGWWDVGLDVTSPQGVFLGVGVPWAPLLPELGYSGQQGVISLDSRLGYAFPLLEHSTLYAELLTAWVHDWGDPCGDGCIVHTHRLFFFPAVGLRHRFSSGFMVGADVALALVQVHYDDEPDQSGWHLKRMSPWVGIAFSQAYAGYSWEF
jgi:hypothetical protein